MTALRIGIKSYEDIKAWTIRIARGEERRAPDDPKIWLTSAESFAKLLSVENRDLLRVIAEQRPGSIEELASLTGRAPSNLSRTLSKMNDYGIVGLERDGRRVVPTLLHDRIELVVPLTRATGEQPVSSGSAPVDQPSKLAGVA